MEERLVEGQRFGRFVVLRDVNGQSHAVAINAVSALAELDDGTLILLPGGRLIQTSSAIGDVLAWLNR